MPAAAGKTRRKETVADLKVIEQVIPYSAPSSRTRAWHVLGPARTVSIVHRVIKATRYEFYFPIAIWHLPATKTFITRIGQLAGGATIFKGATGVWKSEKKPKRKTAKVVEEDVYIYRLIVDAREFSANGSRAGIHSHVADLLADLAVCDTSRQTEFLFTESQIVMDRSIITKITPNP
jgi:hypothetical protein